MTTESKWLPTPPLRHMKKPRKDAWSLIDPDGNELARIYEADQPDADGLTYCWAIWPFHVNGNVGGARTGADARLKCEKMLAGNN